MNSSFMSWLRQSAAAKRFVIITFLLCLGYYILETINGRAQMADFRVYYDAANAFLHNTPLYGKSFGVSSGFYKYSPFACIPFIPLAVFPYAVASVIYYLLVTFSMIWFSLYLVFLIQKKNEDTGKQSAQHVGWILFVVALFMADHLERELHLGNVNLFLLVGAVFSFVLIEKNKTFAAGVIFGILLLFKPHFLILLPYFIWKKQWRLITTSVLTIVSGLFIPALIKGFGANHQLLLDWLGAMRDHNMKLEESPNTVYGIVNHFVLNHQGGSFLVITLLGMIGALFIWFILYNQKKNGNNKVQFIEYFLLIALIPNLTHTDTEHFMWTWPLLALIIFSMFNQRQKMNWLYVAMMVIAFIPYSLNSPDIVGRNLEHLFDEGGLLGIANLMIVAVAVMLNQREPIVSTS